MHTDGELGAARDAFEGNNDRVIGRRLTQEASDSLWIGY